jgi:hypothetical protein
MIILLVHNLIPIINQKIKEADGVTLMYEAGSYCSAVGLGKENIY